MVFSSNLAALIVARGLDAAKLARLAGMGQTGVYDILHGRSASPKISTVEKLARALDVPVYMLFLEPDELADQRVIMALFAKLPKSERDRLILTAEAWAAAAPAPR